MLDVHKTFSDAQTCFWTGNLYPKCSQRNLKKPKGAKDDPQKEVPDPATTIPGDFSLDQVLKGFEFSEEHMGTTVRIVAYAEDSAQVAVAAAAKAQKFARDRAKRKNRSHRQRQWRQQQGQQDLWEQSASSSTKPSDHSQEAGGAWGSYSKLV